MTISLGFDSQLFDYSAFPLCLCGGLLALQNSPDDLTTAIRAGLTKARSGRGISIWPDLPGGWRRVSGGVPAGGAVGIAGGASSTCVGMVSHAIAVLPGV